MVRVNDLILEPDKKYTRKKTIKPIKELLEPDKIITYEKTPMIKQ